MNNLNNKEVISVINDFLADMQKPPKMKLLKFQQVKEHIRRFIQEAIDENVKYPITAYARVSTKDQTTIEGQLEECKERYEPSEGEEVLSTRFADTRKTYRTNATSVEEYVAKLPGLFCVWQLSKINKIVHNKFGVCVLSKILIFKSDRLGRNDMADVVVNSIKNNGAVFWSVLEGNDNFSRGTHRFLSKQESSNLGQRVIKGQKDAVRLNGKQVGRPPLGFVIRKKLVDDNKVVVTWVVDKEKAQVVKEIFNDFVNGKSIQQLSKLYETQWTNIWHMLQNRFYVGLIRNYKRHYEGNVEIESRKKVAYYKSKYPAIIELELFKQAQNKLKQQGVKLIDSEVPVEV